MVDNIDPASHIPAPLAASAGGGQQGRQQQARDQPGRRAVVDVATVMGLPENVMPAAVQDAFLQLVAEVERLRDEVERVRQHEAMLLGATDHHPFLPALNRRAFLAGLTRVLQASERADLPGTVAVFHIEGIEALRRTRGLRAGDAALAFVAAAIQNELRQTDLLAYLDASDFAVTLAVAEDGGATSKLERIAARLKTTPLSWDGRPISLGLAVGLIHFQPGMTAERALAEAYQAMISAPVTR